MESNHSVKYHSILDGFFSVLEVIQIVLIVATAIKPKRTQREKKENRIKNLAASLQL